MGGRRSGAGLGCDEQLWYRLLDLVDARFIASISASMLIAVLFPPLLRCLIFVSSPSRLLPRRNNGSRFGLASSSRCSVHCRKGLVNSRSLDDLRSPDTPTSIR
jgi:hypothetical protein